MCTGFFAAHAVRRNWKLSPTSDFFLTRCLMPKEWSPAMGVSPLLSLASSTGQHWPWGLCHSSSKETLINPKADRKLKSSHSATGQPGSPQELSSCILSLRDKTTPWGPWVQGSTQLVRDPCRPEHLPVPALCGHRLRMLCFPPRIALAMGTLNFVGSVHTPKSNWRLTVLT